LLLRWQRRVFCGCFYAPVRLQMAPANSGLFA
jgi:hypothetical protein